jgi:hypothetical protein
MITSYSLEISLWKKQQIQAHSLLEQVLLAANL